MSNEPKQMQRAVEAFVADVSDAMRDVVSRLPSIDGRKLESDVTTEAFNLVTALIDVDRRHTDAELWGVIFSFWRLMPDELGAAKADDLRQSDLFVGRSEWLEKPSPMAEILISADRRFGTANSRTYYDRALHLAFTVAALDASPSRAELGAIDRLRTHLLDAMDGLPSSPLAGRGPATAKPQGEGGADAGDGGGGEGSPPAAAVRADSDIEEEAETEEELPPARPLEEVLAELQELVGLDSVKTEVRLVTNLLRVQQLRAERDLPTSPQSRHLVFTGNPGTGKTTVARLLSQIYRSLDVVDKGHLVETDRSDLVAGYVGQTATKTRAVLESAVGGTLLIDEAYSLARGGDTDFGREAIDTLVKFMEDHRDDLAIVACGYPAEMAELIDANPGLASRFTRTIVFPDYTTDEIVAIFELMAGGKEYHLDADGTALLRAIVDAEPRGRGFGNARLARNLFEEAVNRQALRLASVEAPTRDELTTLTAADIDRPPDTSAP